jgi:hypothetical protein
MLLIMLILIPSKVPIKNESASYPLSLLDHFPRLGIFLYATLDLKLAKILFLMTTVSLD